RSSITLWPLFLKRLFQARTEKVQSSLMPSDEVPWPMGSMLPAAVFRSLSKADERVPGGSFLKRCTRKEAVAIAAVGTPAMNVQKRQPGVGIKWSSIPSLLRTRANSESTVDRFSTCSRTLDEKITSTESSGNGMRLPS